MGSKANTIPATQGSVPPVKSGVGVVALPQPRRVLRAGERIVSNLFPVVELPKYIFSAESPFTTEPEIIAACAPPGPLPALLKGSRLFSFDPFSEKFSLASALKQGDKISKELASEWFAEPERAGWIIQLLDNMLRYHAWKRGLHFDDRHKLFHFTRSKPKKIWWEIEGQTVSREVTAPNYNWNPAGEVAECEAQYGWKHEALRAGFIRLPHGMFLRLEPSWLLTELDGKTPATLQPVRPVSFTGMEGTVTAESLRSLEFWTAVLGKGHRELRVDAGINPIRVRLTPASASVPSGIPKDRMDYGRLSLLGIEKEQRIPELRPFEC